MKLKINSEVIATISLAISFCTIVFNIMYLILK